ncbi:hypothetical protein CEF21_12505 [Bacillus sp. FJAT-42376]|uniref:hypothetical protein n=1 Tax=Bacillus sp. FJAT-42376 TaxID=2014076 RepID=UPI000F4D754E|nr:hypothetical protein [Bacillus sp. FJAT-42376]AZB43059.1 hypothetical protein CEF21_12505 [Bacillus sp. FJAT-42376]
MPYHKNKQQSFQAAQQEYTETKSHFENMDPSGADYGSHLKHLQEEINETQSQIQNALENATGRQRSQLEQFQKDISGIVEKINPEQ